LNSRQQGAIGVGHAVAYYAAKGYAVFIPVADVSRYDLIVDTGTELLRVEVKTTAQKSGAVTLRTAGGNQSWNGTVKRLSVDDCDLVFVVNILTGSQREYPIAEIAGRNQVTIR
jgi:hypothetical protein